jgi:vancomycin resistance protein YoaR
LPLFILAAAYLVATIDIRSHDGRVARGVELAGVNVGGLDNAELDAELERINSFVVTAPVYIETPEAAYQIDAERLGLQLDRTATRAATLATGREGSAAMRPFSWFGSLFSAHEVDAVLRLDGAAAEAGLAAVSKTISVEPGEPSLVLNNGRLELEPGSPGSILDVSRLLRDLSTSLPSEPGAPINVQAYTTADAMIDVEIQGLVDQLNGQSVQPISLMIDGQLVSMPGADFRGLVELVFDGPEPRARLNSPALFEWINSATGIAEPSIDTTTLIVEGSQVRLPASNAALCCQVDTADRLLEAVLAGDQPVEIALIRDDVTPLVELGISELMAEFTTNHPSGQARVTNIQRMADIVRGAIIEPGGEFSLNNFVGERTTNKGFVPAGVIYNGVFAEDVGGGVSQFATTLFNAAFFAGLDLNAYQAHSIYIDRYPYGREATVNWPGVDLRIGNPTDFPVLIWPEYTAGSITVKLFGTAVVIGEQTGQTEEAVGECTRVRTERTRTWVDGRVEVDSVSAIYQPEEGLNCDGQPTIAPPECAEGEALVDTTENGFGDTCAPLSVICPENTVPIIDETGTIDFCDARVCPADMTPTDTDGDGAVDQCIANEPAPEPTPEPTPEPAPEPDADDSSGDDAAGDGDSDTP